MQNDGDFLSYLSFLLNKKGLNEDYVSEIIKQIRFIYGGVEVFIF